MILLVALLLAAAPAPPPSTVTSSSLERLTRDVVRPVEAAGFEGPIGVYVEGTPAPPSRAIGSLVMGGLAALKLAPVPIVAKDATEAERLAREQGLKALVRLTVSFESPRLVVRGDALSTWVNFWSGETATRSGPAAAIVASVDADLEALTLVGAGAPIVSTRSLELNLGVITRTQGWPAALTLGDVDGDKKAEVLALIDDVVVTWSADGKLRHRVELQSTLSTRPTREPFGALFVTASKVSAWSSRREKTETFTWERGGLRSTGFADSVAPGPFVVTPRAGFVNFAKDFTWSGKSVTWPEPVQSLAPFATMVLGVGAGGNAAIARGNAPTSVVSGVGAGSTLADFDGDGTPEVIVTNARSLGDGDEVRVLSLGAFESVQSRGGNIAEASALWSRKLEGRVVLAAPGDLDGDGVDEVVLGSWLTDGSCEFVVIRRSP